MSSNFGSLFGGGGGLGGSTTTPQQSQQQQQSASIYSPNNQSSIFGNTSTAQPAANNSLFGGQSQAQPQPGQSIFGQSQTQSTRPSGQGTQPAFFNSLLERGKKRPLSVGGQNTSFDELPSLQLGLDDIRRKARELGSGGGPKDSQHGIKNKG